MRWLRVGRAPAAVWLMGAALLAACEWFGPTDAGVPLEGVRTTGRQLPGSLADDPTGPHVELLTAVVAGQEMEIAMQRDGAGVCFAIRRPPASSESCGPLPGNEPGMSAFSLTLIDGPPLDTDSIEPIAVAGLVTAEVAAVVIEMEDGSEAVATLFPLAPAQVEGTGFVVYVPPDARQRSLVARDGDGTELERLQVVEP